MLRLCVSLVLAAGVSGLAAQTSGKAAEPVARPPQLGGTLTVTTVYPTISALSWDLADWNWKQNHDTGMYYEQLFAADLSKARSRGGPHAFRDPAWLPLDAVRGELAESWSWKENPLRLEIRLRKGVMFPEKKGVMAARELVADDVVFSHERQVKSPKAQKGFFEHVLKVEALDRHTVQYTFKDFFAEWDYRSGYGHYSGIQPREVVAAGASNWRNHNGTGPFMLTDHVNGNSNTYVRNPVYWDRERVDGVEYKLPYVDRLIYRVIKDEASQHAALRTGKIDILESVSWEAAEELRKQVPQLKWARYVHTGGTYLAMRMDQKPFDDIRVRRALNLAVNKPEMIKTFWGGNAELFAYPMYPDWTGYYEPLSAMPESVKELFTYNPDKAKQLLAEAGYPNGFTFKVQVNASSAKQQELISLVAAYLAKVNVKLQIEPLEYAAFLSRMTTKTHGPAYFMDNGHGNPTMSIRKNFGSNETWNTSMYSDPSFDRRMTAIYAERVEARRQQMVKELTREVVDKAPYIWLPVPYNYIAWWPWVQNYGGELRAGSVRPGPIYARIWIDHDMKKRMGFR